MRSMMLVGLAMTFVFYARAAADEPAKSPKQEFDTLVRAQQDAQDAFSRANRAGTTKEERDKDTKEFQQQGAGFAKFIQAYPNDPVALKAMEWLLRREPSGQATTMAMQSLGDKIIKSQEMEDFCRS